MYLDIKYDESIDTSIGEADDIKRALEEFLPDKIGKLGLGYLLLLINR
jgi:hypothetical protein